MLLILLLESGEPVGARTRDLLIKSQLLYQLSYRPTRDRGVSPAPGTVKWQIPAPSGRLSLDHRPAYMRVHDADP